MQKILLTMIVTSLLIALPQASEQSEKVSKSSGIKNRVATIDAYCKGIDKYVKESPDSQRIFANTASAKDQPGWEEFKSEADRQEADDDESAFVWIRNGKVVLVGFTFQSSSRDWVHYVHCYYREDGTLAKVDAQLNTFYGYMMVIRKRYYDSSGKLLHSSLRYLDMHTGKPKKPGRDFIDDPVIAYKDIESLPFYKLLQ